MLTSFSKPSRRAIRAACVVIPVLLFSSFLIIRWFPASHRSHSDSVLHISHSSTVERNLPSLLLNSTNIAIISAITGTIDQPKLRPGPSVFLYDESTAPLPFPRQDVNQRLRAKYFRTSAHWLHPGYSAYIWVDGQFSIDPIELPAFMAKHLGSADCAFFKHPERQDIVQEAEFVVHGLEAGWEYFRVRYEGEPMKAQVDAYLAEGFPVEEYPLIASGLFIRRNLPHVNAAFDHWLIENLKWSIQDQLSLPYILWRHNLTFNLVTNATIDSGPYHQNDGHVDAFQR